MSEEKTHHVAIWTIGDPRQIPPRVCVDDTGALMLFDTPEIAEVFATELRTYSLTVAIHTVSSRDIAELLDYNLSDPGEMIEAADRAIVVEAQATSREDAHQWAIELAGRFMSRLVEEFTSARTHERTAR